MQFCALNTSLFLDSKRQGGIVKLMCMVCVGL